MKMATPGMNYDYLLKYIIIGDAAVGKSNLLLRFSQDDFKSEYQLTIGVEFGAKNLDIDNKKYRLQIWDTAGQENYRSITRAYYKNSVCAILVYDISNRDSFEHISSWIEDCLAQSPKTVFMVLVGNKSDLNEKRKVTFEEDYDLLTNIIPGYTKYDFNLFKKMREVISSRVFGVTIKGKKVKVKIKI